MTLKPSASTLGSARALRQYLVTQGVWCRRRGCARPLMTRRVGRRGAAWLLPQAGSDAAEGLLLSEGAATPGARPHAGSRGEGGSGDEEQCEGTGLAGGASVCRPGYAPPVSSEPAKERGRRPSHAPSWRAGLEDDTRHTAPSERRGLRSERGAGGSGRVGLRAPTISTEMLARLRRWSLRGRLRWAPSSGRRRSGGEWVGTGGVAGVTDHEHERGTPPAIVRLLGSAPVARARTMAPGGPGPHALRPCEAPQPARSGRAGGRPGMA